MNRIPAPPANPGVDSNTATAAPQPQPSLSDFQIQQPPVSRSESKATFGIAQLRLPQDYAAASHETVQVEVPVNRPRNETFFRAHPEWQLYAATLTFEETLHLITGNLHEALNGEHRPKLLVPFVTRDGDFGIWPLSIIQPTGKTDSWTTSAHRALAASRKSWVRMRSNMTLRSYDLIQPKATWEEPSWDGQDFDLMIEMAFTDKVISTIDHPVVRALRGES